MGSEDRPWQDAELLEQLYYGEELSQPQMAKRLGCSRWTIRKWMERHEIETRDQLEGRYVWYRKQPDVTFQTNSSGYEEIRTGYKNEENRFYLHRLLAVSKYGFEAVKDKHVHHKTHIHWDNRPANIELMDPGEHKTHHLHIQHGNEQMPEP